MAWTAILIAVTATANSGGRDKLLLVVGGWAIGSLSATIAQAVYPPPKRTRNGP